MCQKMVVCKTCLYDIQAHCYGFRHIVSSDIEHSKHFVPDEDLCGQSVVLQLLHMFAT